jgi:hypothetical protein
MYLRYDKETKRHSSALRMHDTPSGVVQRAANGRNKHCGLSCDTKELILLSAKAIAIINCLKSSQSRTSSRRVMRNSLAVFATMISLSACSSTDAEVTRQAENTGKLPYPDQFYVYDFAVSPAGVPADSAEADELSAATDDPQANAERNALERDIAEYLSIQLVDRLKGLGLPAVRWAGPAPKNQNSYSLEGQFVTIDEGNAVKRMIIGFGAGGVEVRVLAQIYQLRSGARHLLGEAEVSAESSKKPGLAATLPIGAAISGVGTAAAVGTGIGVITEMNTDVRESVEDTADAIVELLEPRMEDHGWL